MGHSYILETTEIEKSVKYLSESCRLISKPTIGLGGHKVSFLYANKETLGVRLI